MLRFVFASALVCITAAAAAADPCATTPADPTPRAMSLALAPDGSLFVPAGTSEFPAVSKDGRMIAHLFVDEEDFTGAPMTTLVVWSRTGKKLGSYYLGGQNPTPAKQAKKLLAAANLRLAGTRWRPLAMHSGCADGPGIALDGDARITFDEDTATVMRTTAGRTTKLRAGFPSPGAGTMETKGGCGSVVGLASAFGGTDIGIAVLIPRVNLGGDSCFGLGTAESAAVVPLR